MKYTDMIKGCWYWGISPGSEYEWIFKFSHCLENAVWGTMWGTPKDGYTAAEEGQITDMYDIRLATQEEVTACYPKEKIEIEYEIY